MENFKSEVDNYKAALEIIAKQDYDSYKIMMDFAINHPDLFVSSYNRSKGYLDESDVTRKVVEVYNNSTGNKVVDAIKIHRELTNSTLRVAKEFVDDLRFKGIIS